MIEQFYCTHEESDQRMVYHISQLPSASNIVICTNDTDVSVILLGLIDSLSHLRIWLDIGVAFNNSWRYVYVNEVAQYIGVRACLAMPSLHGLTGCDYTAVFYRKGKVVPLKKVFFWICTRAFKKSEEKRIFRWTCFITWKICLFSLQYDIYNSKWCKNKYVLK